MAGTGKSLKAAYGKPQHARVDGPDSVRGNDRNAMGCFEELVSALRPSEYAAMNFVKNMNAWQPRTTSKYENCRCVIYMSL
jgi:hypothetical protein